MSDPLSIALITAGSVVTGQIVSLVINIRANNRQNKQLIEIHTDTNGNLTKFSNALDTANKKIESLEKMLTSKAARRKKGAV